MNFIGSLSSELIRDQICSKYNLHYIDIQPTWLKTGNRFLGKSNGKNNGKGNSEILGGYTLKIDLKNVYHSRRKAEYR